VAAVIYIIDGCFLKECSFRACSFPPGVRGLDAFVTELITCKWSIIFSCY
jgi:hypothetical protein